MIDEADITLPVIGEWVRDQPYFHDVNQAQFRGNEKNEWEIKLAKRAYDALIMQVDRKMNQIIGTLREEGMLENTWFIFTSDHGDNLGDHLLWGKRNFLRGSTQVPFVITPPIRGDIDEIMGEQWVPGLESKYPVGLIDIFPTCLDIAGVDLPHHLAGESLLSHVLDQESADQRYILGEIGTSGSRTIMVTDGKWKYIWYEQDGKELLFDIQNDPYELSNLAKQEQEPLGMFRGHLIEVLAKRKNDRALKEDKLNPVDPSMMLCVKDRNRLATDHNVRGLH